MIIVDAGVLVVSLVESTARADAARSVLRSDPHWLAPVHTRLEAVRTLARYERMGVLTASDADHQVARLRDAELESHEVTPGLLDEIWRLRHNVSAYDAAYVALARAFDLPIVSLDDRLARAVRPLGVDVVVPAA